MVMVARMNELTNLSDDALVASLEDICAKESGLKARFILHLMEVEERRLHLKAAYSSMFDFCTRRLGMSEGAAYRRITVVRLARRFPRLLASLERGDVSLETLALVRNHLTEANVDEVLAAVTRKSTRQVEEILASRAPQPDATSLIRRLPDGAAPVAHGTEADVAGAGQATGAGHPASSTRASRTATASRGRIEPIADARYRLQITASAELCAKVERARALLRHRNPSGDLSIVIERALDALIDKLEKERLGKPARPRSTASGSAETTAATAETTAATAETTAATIRATRAAPTKRASCAVARPGISRALRREVFERDGERCTFVSSDGARCPSQAFLELDHVQPHALGGETSAANLRVMCRAHNGLRAEQSFGRSVVERGWTFGAESRRSETRRRATRWRPRSAGSRIWVSASARRSRRSRSWPLVIPSRRMRRRSRTSSGRRSRCSRERRARGRRATALRLR